MKKDKEKLQKELLSKYFAIKENTATIQLYFDTFSSLVDNEFGNKNVEKLNGILEEKINTALVLLPRKYFINIDITIKDFENYTEEEAKRIINENIILKVYTLAVDSRRKRKNSVILCLVGIVVLILSYFTSNLNMPQIINDIINIAGTLFIWESFSINFIERSSDIKQANQYMHSIKEITVHK